MKAVQSFMKKLTDDDQISVLCLLSHGGDATICGTDGQKVAINEITKLFSRAKFEVMIGKPKLFIIQACRGGEH